MKYNIKEDGNTIATIEAPSASDALDRVERKYPPRHAIREDGANEVTWTVCEEGTDVVLDTRFVKVQ